MRARTPRQLPAFCSSMQPPWRRLPRAHRRKSSRGLQGASSGATSEDWKRKKAATCASALPHIKPWQHHLPLSFFGPRRFRARLDLLAIAHRDQYEEFSRRNRTTKSHPGAELGKQIHHHPRRNPTAGGLIDCCEREKRKNWSITHREARLGRDGDSSSHRREKSDWLAD